MSERVTIGFVAPILTTTDLIFCAFVPSRALDYDIRSVLCFEEGHAGFLWS